MEKEAVGQRRVGGQTFRSRSVSTERADIPPCRKPVSGPSLCLYLGGLAKERRMAQYTVRIRGSTPMGEIYPGHGEDQGISDERLKNAEHLSPSTMEADTAKGAAAHALSGFPRDGSVLLVYVEDGGGRIEVFWPTGEPLAYVRKDAPSVQIACSVQVSDACVGEHRSGETAVAIDGDGWACESCAAIVAPGI